jgi:hypothetical protein
MNVPEYKTTNLFHKLEKLALGCTGVTQQEDVDVSSQLGAFSKGG